MCAATRSHDYAYNGAVVAAWGKGHPTEGVEIVSIEPRAVEPVYSVVMDDPHIWIANGIATSNSFNRSHAYGYAILGFWTAWLKFHYPIEFLTAILSTVEKGRIPEFINEARRMGFRVLPPDVNLSGQGFTAGKDEVRYGFDNVKGVGDAAIKAIVPNQPFSSMEDFMERKGTEINAGHIKTLAAVGAFDSIYPNRKALETKLAWETDGSANRCVLKDESVDNHGLPCRYDWENEPVTLGKSGRPLKQKPIPKRCTKACRQWTEPVLELDEIEPYTDDEIMKREMDLLGVHLSMTPFDKLPPEVLALGDTGESVEEGDNGRYMVIGILNKVRTHIASNGKEMAFLGIYARDIVLDVTVFNDEWSKYKSDMRPGVLCAIRVDKNDRGLSLSSERRDRPPSFLPI